MLARPSEASARTSPRGPFPWSAVVTTSQREEQLISEPRINDRIRVPEVRLVGPNGEQVGIVRVEDALRLAQEADLDLVEVAPDARPPVCKLMDYGKFKYESAMKARDARRNQASTVLKEIRFRLKIDPHDYGTKMGHVERFLKAGDKVKVMIMFRGREQSRPEAGMRLLQRLADDVAELGFVESAPRLDGRNMIMVLAPSKKKVEARGEQRRRTRDDAAPAPRPTAAADPRPAAAPAPTPVAPEPAPVASEPRAPEPPTAEPDTAEPEVRPAAEARPAPEGRPSTPPAEAAPRREAAPRPAAAPRPSTSPRPAPRTTPATSAPSVGSSGPASAPRPAATPPSAPRPSATPRPAAPRPAPSAPTPRPAAPAARPAPRPSPSPRPPTGGAQDASPSPAPRPSPPRRPAPPADG